MIEIKLLLKIFKRLIYAFILLFSLNISIKKLGIIFPINIFNIFIVSILGIPGLICLIIIKLILF